MKDLQFDTQLNIVQCMYHTKISASCNTKTYFVRSTQYYLVKGISTSAQAPVSGLKDYTVS